MTSMTIALLDDGRRIVRAYAPGGPVAPPSPAVVVAVGRTDAGDVAGADDDGRVVGDPRGATGAGVRIVVDAPPPRAADGVVDVGG